MDELTFILILAGIGVVLLVAMFTYYKHHKKINDEIENFNYHADTIDDVLLNNNQAAKASNNAEKLTDSELPGSFSASRQDNFDIDQVNISNDNLSVATESDINTGVGNRELVDGVYINSKRVINSSSAAAEQKTPGDFKKTTETFASFVQNEKQPDSPPTVSSETSDSIANNKQQSESRSSQEIKVVYDALPEGVEELIISHAVLTKGDFFSGQQVYDALKNAGLSFGEMNIFHYPGDDKPSTFALFSVANVIEPGTFDLQAAETMKTPGISLFMRLPTRIDCYEAYEKFIDVAQMIATELGGELCDETRSQLTQQTIAYKKELIKKLNFAMEKAKKLADMK